MKEPLGDTLFYILLGAFCLVIILGWVYVIVISFLQWLFPKWENKFEILLKKANKPLELIQKFSIYGAIVLVLLRLIASGLGWAPPLLGFIEI